MTYNFQQQFPPYRSTGYRLIPVANEYEMNNVTVDFNGTPTYFHNQNSNEIYIRQFDIKTGMTTTQKFVHSEGVNESVKEEPQASLYEDKFNAINERLDGLYELLDKGGKK